LSSEAILATFQRSRPIAGASIVATDNIIPEHLRAIRSTPDGLAQDMREVKSRLGNIESQVGMLTAQYASLSNRLDRMDERVGRIERGLDLVDG
jgi:uncharacterized protein YabE (DUF348 family)